MEPGPDLIEGVVCYMDDVFGLYAVHTDFEEEQVNGYFAKVATSDPPPLVLNVEEKSNTLRFLELVITMDADRLICRLWNSVARHPGSGDTVLTRLLMMTGGTNMIGRLSWAGWLVLSTELSRDALVMMILCCQYWSCDWR